MATESRESYHKGEDEESSEEMAEMLFAKRRCCFCISSCFGSNRSPGAGRNWWRSARAAETEGGWWARGITALEKFREWSEIVAGPRWKTFIRRFNRNKSGGGGKHGKFQYDPISYALNFDDSAGQNGNLDEEFGFRSFSFRYAAIPVSAKSLVDLGKDAPIVA